MSAFRPLLLASLAAVATVGCMTEQQLELVHRAAIGELRLASPPEWCRIQVREVTREGAVLYIAIPSARLLSENADAVCTPDSLLAIDRTAAEIAVQQARRGYAVESRRAYGLNRDGSAAAGQADDPPDLTVLVSIVRFSG
jgi:hypothetical protein